MGLPLLPRTLGGHVLAAEARSCEARRLEKKSSLPLLLSPDAMLLWESLEYRRLTLVATFIETVSTLNKCVITIFKAVWTPVVS